MTTIKRCACGATYTAEQWQQLPLRGTLRGSGWIYVTEMRDCRCHSSLCVPEWQVYGDRHQRLCERLGQAIRRYNDASGPLPILLANHWRNLWRRALQREVAGHG